MDIHDFRDLLRTVDYKPGTRLDLISTFGSDAYALSIYLEVLDAITHEKTNFSLTEPMPDRIKDHDSFLDWVFDCLILAETHEAKEFFRYKNRHWMQPHPESSHHERAAGDRAYLKHKQDRQLGKQAKLAAQQAYYQAALERAMQPAPEMIFKDHEWPLGFDQPKFFKLDPPAKPTPNGERKKEKRARSEYKKGFSNKPWEALR